MRISYYKGQKRGLRTVKDNSVYFGKKVYCCCCMVIALYTTLSKERSPYMRRFRAFDHEEQLNHTPLYLKTNA